MCVSALWPVISKRVWPVLVSVMWISKHRVGGPQTPCADLPLDKDSVENTACKFISF